MATETEAIQESIKSQEILRELKKPGEVDGTVVYEDITIYPLMADGDKGAVIRIDDVTEKNQMEEVMIQSEKMLSVGGLAAGIAHEINNPIAGMVQTAGVMSSRLGENLDIPANIKAAESAGTTIEAIHQFMEARGILRMINTITESGRRANVIVDNMLNFARKGDNVKELQDLTKLLETTLALASADYNLLPYQ